MDISEENLVVGMEDGHVHIVNYSTGCISKSFWSHDRQVNDVSVDNAGTTIVSCSDAGVVKLYYMGMDGEKENVVYINLFQLNLIFNVFDCLFFKSLDSLDTFSSQVSLIYEK